MNVKMIFVMISLFVYQAFADLTIYSDRPQARFAPAVAAFEKQTGQKVVFVEAPYKDLLQKLDSEGKKSPADLVVTKDLVYLSELTRKGHLQSLAETPALKRVASFMRGDKNEWVALSYRVRSIAYDPATVQPSELTSYADLVDPKWMGRLCLRTSKAAYNEALVSMLIAQNGEAKTKEMIGGWLDNTGMPSMSDDTAILNEIAAQNSPCDIGIVNHYYLAMAINKNPNFPVRFAFLDQGGQGVHTNGTGIGLVKSSKQANLAQTFVDILLSDAVQLEFSAAHFEFPAVQGLTPSTFIKEWGTYKMSPVQWSEIGNLVPKARQLMGEIGYL